ncbi:MAG: hypothetical protein HYU64_02435 [Armatimonadetes bacterium]|nr:hypothetical protein [Armatimonadota bacterium]
MEKRASHVVVAADQTGQICHIITAYLFLGFRGAVSAFRGLRRYRNRADDGESSVSGSEAVISRSFSV